MTSLDDVSVAIGALKADMASSQRQRADQYEKIDQMSTDIAEIKSAISTMVDRMTAFEKGLEDCQTRVSKLEHAKTWVLGAASAISLLAGSIGAWFTKNFGGMS